MTRTTRPTLFSRIQVRAYYFAEASGWTLSPLSAWLAAESIEVALATKRSAAAKRAAATRRANAAKVVAFDALPVTHIPEVIRFEPRRRVA